MAKKDHPFLLRGVGGFLAFIAIVLLFDGIEFNRQKFINPPFLLSETEVEANPEKGFRVAEVNFGQHSYQVANWTDDSSDKEVHRMTFISANSDYVTIEVFGSDVIPCKLEQVISHSVCMPVNLEVEPELKKLLAFTANVIQSRGIELTTKEGQLWLEKQYRQLERDLGVKIVY